MLKKKENKLLKSKNLWKRKLTKPKLELLKLRKLKKLPRMLLETPRKMLLPGNKGHKMPKRKLPKKWPKTRKRPSKEKPSLRKKLQNKRRSMTKLLLLKLPLTKRLKIKLRPPPKQLKRLEKNLLPETLLLINRRCKSRELLSIKNSEMFGILDQLVFLTSNSQCATANQQTLLCLRCSKKLLQLMLRYLLKPPKDNTELKTEERKPLTTIKLSVLPKTVELLSLLRKLLLTSTLIQLTQKNSTWSSILFLPEVLITLSGSKTKPKLKKVVKMLSRISNLKTFTKKLLELHH